ncbi:MAG: Calx-beta domain-containing protein [Vicingaceae bacterium]
MRFSINYFVPFAALFLVLQGNELKAQTGPGGVGDNSSNLLWLESDSITGLVDDDDVTTWTDGSSNGNDLSQPNATFKPVYKTAIVNGHPVVRFNVTNGRLRRTSFTFPTTTITAIYVNANTESNDGAFSYASTSSNNDFLLFNSSSLNVYRGGNTNSGIVFNDNAFNIANVSWQSSNGGVQVWKNGNPSYSATGFQTSSSITSGGCLAIGAEQDAIDGSYDASQDHQGDFAEVILYNTYLNDAQHIIVANYLSAKYGISISNDHFSYQSTHPHDVAGIGREDASNIHSAARSANVLQFQNPTGMQSDGEYLLFGHDDADLTTAWTTSDAPGGGTDIQRLAREWRLDETGNVDTVDVIVNTANFPSLPAGHTMYALMVDADGSFASGSSVYELVLSSGSLYTATGIAINDGDYVAIAAVNPKVEHVTTTSSNFETANATFQVRLNFIAETDKTVDYTTADGTALAAQPDYTAASGVTLTILADTSGAEYTISQTNDAVVETDETYTITLSNPSSGLTIGTNSVHTHTIQDDDNARKVYFDVATANGSESVTSVNVGLSINNLDLTNPTSVDYTVTGGTAVGGGTDYTLAAGTVTFPVNTTTNSFSFTVNNESLYEIDETIEITLSVPVNCNLDGVAPFGGTGFIVYTYTINDNDTPPDVEFSATTSSGLESVASVDFQVTLDQVSGADASVSYALTGTATGGGVDYTLAAGTVTIVEGSLTNDISGIIIDDGIEELSETIIITLSAPVNCALGSDTVHTYSILDNDQFGFTGPGGVGQASNNVLWVRSEDIPAVSDGTDITTWIDSSGNGHDLTQGNTSFTPRYYANVLNGRPVVRFEQANNRIIHNGFTDFPNTAITAMFVNRNSDSGDGLFSYASSSSDNEFLLFSSNSASIYRGGSNVGTGQALNGNTWRIVGVSWESVTGATLLHRNGTQSYSGTLAASTSITSGGNFCLAGEQDGINSGYSAGQSHQGDYTEFIIYNRILNSAQRKIVENYLSAKFNIAVATDLYAYDSPGNYEHEVAGIGRDDASNFHIDAKGKGLVRMNNPSSLDDGDYMLWGDDSVTFTSANLVDVPSGVHNRMERIWRVDQTGDVGTVTVMFNLADFTIGNSSDLVLLIDSDDGVFANASQTSISSFSANTAVFDGVDFADGDWFTIASLSPSNPLPVELLEFSATAGADVVRLFWKTLSEINNDRFVVQRSGDAKKWSDVTSVPGAGNSHEEKHYNAIDAHPLTGTSYYRLKQIDANGAYSYSDIVAVIFDQAVKRSIRVYPNPWDQQTGLTLELKGFNAGSYDIELTSTSGQLWHRQRQSINHERENVQLEFPAHLEPGLYFLTVRDGISLKSVKVIVQ